MTFNELLSGWVERDGVRAVGRQKDGWVEMTKCLGQRYMFEALGN